MHACILGMLILQCKINKNRGQGELGIGTALCQEEGFAIVQPRIHHMVIYRHAYCRVHCISPWKEKLRWAQRVRWTDCPVHSYTSPPCSTGLHAKGAGHTQVALVLTAWSYTWTQPSPGGAATQEGVLWHQHPWMGPPQQSKSNFQVLKGCDCILWSQSHTWTTSCMGPAAPFRVGQEALTYQLLAAIDRELSTACTLLNRQSSPRTSWIHYPGAVTWLNGAIKIRCCRLLKAHSLTRTPPKKTHLQIEPFIPRKQSSSQLSPG